MHEPPRVTGFLGLRRRTMRVIATVVVTVVSSLVLVPTASAARSPLVVPTAFPTIQAAVDAAQPGDQIMVRPGTYREQLSISKSLSIVGSGAAKTTILAPQTHAPSEDGKGSIVEIRGASVAISGLTVSGPGQGTCEDNPLEAGIRVVAGGHLDLRFARVVHIRNSATVACVHSGVGILVGVVTDPGSGTAVIRDSAIADYGTKGILILSEGPATITHNVVTGSPQLPADGIDALFSASTVSQNIVSGNVCPAGDPVCGPDFFNQFQHAGIFAGGHANTVVTGNVVFGNQVGIYALDGEVNPSHNVLIDNGLSGLALQDGDYTAMADSISGGTYGVVVVAVLSDTSAALRDIKIVRTSAAPVTTLQCCGFTATLR